MNARKFRIAVRRGRIFLVFFLVTSLAFFASCSRKVRPDKSREIIAYPAPPDTARIQYLTSISTSFDVVGERSKFGEFLVGREEPLPILKPYGVAVSDGKIYLCDLDKEGLEILDMNERTFTYFQPRGLGKLELPINCTLDEEGKLFVTDTKRKQVIIYNKQREYAGSIGDGNGKPSDVAVLGDSIFVSDILRHRVDVYKNDSTLELLYSIPNENSDGKKLHQPTNIYATNEALYVSDFGEFNIKVFDLEGKYLQTIGSFGRALGQFVRPKGIAVDKEGVLYVVDAGFENIQMFNKQGQLLMFFGGSYSGPGDMWLPAKVTISYENIEFFDQFVDTRYTLKYLIFVTNNFGPDRLSVYGYVVPN